MKLPPLPVALAVASASAIWFGFLTWVAFRAGSDWDTLYAYIVRSTKVVGGGAGILVVLLLVAIYVWRKRRRHDP
jgi:membrane protein DedA with SNARE-associated domain